MEAMHAYAQNRTCDSDVNLSNCKTILEVTGFGEERSTYLRIRLSKNDWFKVAEFVTQKSSKASSPRLPKSKWYKAEVEEYRTFTTKQLKRKIYHLLGPKKK